MSAPSPAPAPSRAARGARVGAGFAATALAAGLLVLALPIAGAALVRLPGDAVLADLRAGAPVAADDLARLAESRRAAGLWRDDPRDAKTWALARLLLAEKAGAGDGPGLRAAEARLSAALAAAPADPYAWTRLALMRWRLDRPAGEVQAALDAARRTGPQVRRLQAVGRALRARLAVQADG